MNVASIDLSRELYELSGWGETELGWWPGARKTPIRTKDSAFEFPAYDLGYLLRKLPSEYEGHRLCLVNTSAGWTGNYTKRLTSPDTPAMGVTAGSPEDAVVKLALACFREGVITRGGDE